MENKNNARYYVGMFLKHISKIIANEEKRRLMLVLFDSEKNRLISTRIENLPPALKQLIANAFNMHFIRIVLADNENPHSLAGHISSTGIVVVLDQHEKACPEVVEVLLATAGCGSSSELVLN